MAVSIARHLTRITCKQVDLLALATVHCQCLPLPAGAAVPRRFLSISQASRARFYTDKHEWVSVENGTGTVGISQYAQEQLGEVVFVELPEVGTDLEAGDMAGCVESVKAASEIYTPVAGSITEVNSSLADEPQKVNSSPLDKGWLFKLKLQSGLPTDGLMDEGAYKKYVGTLE